MRVDVTLLFSIYRKLAHIAYLLIWSGIFVADCWPVCVNQVLSVCFLAKFSPHHICSNLADLFLINQKEVKLHSKAADSDFIAYFVHCTVAT